MVRKRIQTRTALIWGLMPLMATTLVICSLIPMQLVSTNGRVAVCWSEVMKTPAVYLEHIGDEDKPMYPISGILDPTQSHEALAAVAAYFDGRQPELHEHLTSRRF